MEIKTWKTSLAALDEEIKSVKANMDKIADPDMMEKMQGFMEAIRNAIHYVHERIDDIQEDAWTFRREHTTNHLPNPKSASQMETCLKVLGLHEDYEVRKPIITMAKTRQGGVAVAEYVKT